jgi:hypothetical protein
VNGLLLKEGPTYEWRGKYFLGLLISKYGSLLITFFITHISTTADIKMTKLNMLFYRSFLNAPVKEMEK